MRETLLFSVYRYLSINKILVNLWISLLVGPLHYFNIHNKKKLRKIVESSVISNYNIIKQRLSFFQCVSLFNQIGAEKLQNSLFEIIQLHLLYIR